jgi:hypothetical protein
MTHPIMTDEDLKAAAERVENMRYDSGARFLQLLSEAFGERQAKDLGAGKKQLAWHLAQVAIALQDAAAELTAAWGICQGRMEDPLAGMSYESLGIGKAEKNDPSLSAFGLATLEDEDNG